MNLKEAFRFQNKLQALMETALDVLGNDCNVTTVKNIYLRKKAMAEAADETMFDAPTTEYSQQITEIAAFLLHLLDEREKLSAAIYKAKASLDLPSGLDSEINLNKTRQCVADHFRHMIDLRSSEQLIQNGGTGYCFNHEGNQVSYRCDLKRVTTINFDRNRIRKMCTALSKQADAVSAVLDAALINTQVAYAEPFDVNDSFAEIFEAFAGITAV